MTDTILPGTDPSGVQVVTEAGGTTLRLVGEIDMSSWAALERAYAQIAAADPGPVAVDLSAATFLDSTTLGVLVRIDRHLAPAGFRLVLRSPNRTVRRAIEICGLSDVLPVDPPKPS